MSDIWSLWALARPLGGDRIARFVTHVLERLDVGRLLESAATGILAKPVPSATRWGARSV
jgi:hypothetical protein